MRILLLTHSFNSLTQRLFVELTQRGHEVSIEFDINDEVTIEAVALYKPDLIIAPYLRRAIPESIWRNHVCLVVHPGIKGDRGPSALDWAILNGETEWGVTVLQANAEMDAGDVWASINFPMRAARKSSLYRNEVTEAAVRAMLLAIERFERGDFKPEPLDYARPDVRGRLRPLITQADRSIDWARDDTATVLRKIRAADGAPGVLDTLFGREVYLYDAHPEAELHGEPGAIIAQRCGAICRATVNGAVWIGHVKERTPDGRSFKLPAATLFAPDLRGTPELAIGFDAVGRQTWQDIRYEEKNGVGYLHFEFYNGAMSTTQCERLREAYRYARACNTRIIVLMGGHDFWSNGIHLNLIETAESPADESWRNINAMNDLAREIITTESHWTISALQGNAGAGGVFLALAADRIYARSGVVLNPHYKGMGNLYGSEYWTYLLPRRAGAQVAAGLTENRLPIGTAGAQRLGIIDDHFGEDVSSFRSQMERIAESVVGSAELDALLAEKQYRRRQDEQAKPLETYRAEELEHMKLNFYGFDPSYHVARYNFVHHLPHSRTPLYLARHRQLPWLARTRLAARKGAV